MKKRLLIISLCIFCISIPYIAQAGNRSLIINPVGLLFGGLSYAEYEHEIIPQTSALFRFSLIKYNNSEDGIEGYNDCYSWEYKESGFGPGIGTGMRYYFLDESNTVSPFVDVGTDIAIVGWSWEEEQQRRDGSHFQTLDGDGTTTAFAFHLGGGLNINQKNMFLQLGLKAGTLMLDIEKSSGVNGSGIGFFIGPIIAFGYHF